MKKIIYALGLAILFMSFQKSHKQSDYAIISGKITNASSNFNIISADRSFKKKMDIANDGSFSDTLRGAQGIYRVSDGKNSVSLYLDLGNNILINADAHDFINTLTITGEGAETTNYLLEKSKIVNDFSKETRSSYKLEEAAYKVKSKEMKNTLEEMLEATPGISEAYRVNEKRNLNYEYLNNLSKYEPHHRALTENPDFKVSKGFLSEFDEITYDNEEDYSFSDDYKTLVYLHYIEKISELTKANDESLYMIKLKTIAEIPKETIRNDLLFSFASTDIKYSGDLETYYTIFMAASSNEENNAKITETYNKLKSLFKGEPSPKFVNYENHAGGTTSLEDLKGKFVYIDVWATWCGPCKAQIPFLKEIEKLYHDKNIEFVSISVDNPKDYKAWKTMVKDQELGGIQLLADNNFSSKFIEDYFINAIPRFILIDPNGDIVNSNAPRPSSDELIKLFQKLGI